VTLIRTEAELSVTNVTTVTTPENPEQNRGAGDAFQAAKSCKPADVTRCGQTRYQIARATGISEATLSRLASGERFLSPKALDRLGGYLGLRIVRDEPRAKKGR